MRKTLNLLPLLVLMALGACETVEGAGQDMQNAGAAVAEEAREAQSGM
ncbi:entericidin A/B family lipoprotein [Gemmobacter fulvus]|uniref:Entericidin A/B family lipoprotein n=1 Tax=Gemmobacter fulvus TaxID=2840474 RepID=A0A975S1C6_9RHOB|nr:entericidin A/B family lipoprotein [Gemmobacter fulvus]MBT9247028.1 entericidin A/B family lipoprotein [Gemmobacter fulvus]MDQ1847448.1 entericidin A/B family lipoprotein [Gemmobacter fulvus]QWK89798.1 entericidin A/B family lipoprotein [Gemmobacter fulvus]